MAYYQPPVPLNQGKFNPAGYEDPTGALTIEEANSLFLRFPTAQGTENFGDANVVGTLTAGTFNPANITITGKLTTTNASTFATTFGYQTSEPTTGTSIHNTAYGFQCASGLSATTGTGGNTAFGAIAMPSITGACNANTAIGHNALWSLTTGDHNTVVGKGNQVSTITTGSDNTAVGFNAGANANVSFSTSVGSGATTTASGTAVGYISSAIGLGATALGTNSSSSGTASSALGGGSFASGDNSIAIGDATANNTEAIAIGFGAQASGVDSVAIGAGVVNTTANRIQLGTVAETVIVAGNLNTINTDTYGTVFGFETTKPTSGSSINNTAFGYRAGKGFVNTTGSGGNTAFGSLALEDITTTGNSNTAVGYNAGTNITSATTNTIVGASGATSLTTGNANTAIGASTSLSSTTANSVAVGSNSTVGTNAVAVGASASASGSQSVVVGRSSSASASNAISIGYNNTCSGADSVIIGTGQTLSTANTIQLGSINDTVRYMRVSPLYTTVPTYTSAQIGFIQNATITYPTTTTNDIVSYTAPAGTWLCIVCIAFDTGTGANSLSVRNAGTTQGYAPKIPAVGAQDFYSCSVPLVVSTGTAALTVAPATAHSVGTAGGNVGQFIKFIRIA